MTLMNGLSLTNRALLWSDTVCWDTATKKRVGYVSKIMECRPFPGAVNMTTVGLLPQDLIERIAARFLLNLPALLDACENAARQVTTERPGAVVRMLVAGWCEATKTVRMFAITSDEGVANTPPFVATELSCWISSAGASDAAQAIRTRGHATPEDMMAIAEVQRAEPFETPAGTFAPGLAIGGNLVECEVTQWGVESRIARRWEAREAPTTGTRPQRSRLAVAA